MNNSKVLGELQETFEQVFGDGIPLLTHETTAEDINEWDSLSHFELIVAIEKRFCVKITSEETRSFSSVRSFIEFLEKNVD